MCRSVHVSALTSTRRKRSAKRALRSKPRTTSRVLAPRRSFIRDFFNYFENTGAKRPSVFVARPSGMNGTLVGNLREFAALPRRRTKHGSPGLSVRGCRPHEGSVLVVWEFSAVNGGSNNALSDSLMAPVARFPSWMPVEIRNDGFNSLASAKPQVTGGYKRASMISNDFNFLKFFQFTNFLDLHFF